MAVAADVDVEPVVVPGWADSTAWAWVVSAVVLVLVSSAGWSVPLAVAVVLVDGGWASASRAVLLSACPALWGVAVECCEAGVGESVTSAAGWPDAGSAGGVAAGWPLAGVLAAGPDVAGSVSTAPVVLPSFAELGAEADLSSKAVLALADGLELGCGPPLLDTTGRSGCPVRGWAGAEAFADPAVVDCVDPAMDPAAEAAEPGEPDEPGEDSEDAEELVDDEPEEPDDELAGSAHATPYPPDTAAPMPRATANPPTRPTYVAEFVMATSPLVTVTRATPAVT